MRTKAEILDPLKKSIGIVYDSPPWERKEAIKRLEVLIDLRDVLDRRLREIMTVIFPPAEKD